MQRGRRHLRASIVAVIALAAAVAAIAWARSRHSIPSAAWDALADADTYEVWAIGSDLQSGGLELYPFRGKASVTDPQTRTALNGALDRAAKESKGWTALCYEPHHGIRVTARGVTTDFVICFKCLQVQVWQGGKQITGFSTNDTAKPGFDEVLSRAGVKPDPPSP